MNAENASPTPRASAKAPDREELISLLGAEIDHIHNELGRSGLSQWTLIAAFAVTVWMLFDAATKPGLDWVKGLQAGVAFFLMVDFSRSLVGIFTHRKQKRRSRRRYRFGYALSEVRPALFVGMVRCILLIVVALALFRHGPRIPALLVGLVYGGLGILLGFLLWKTFKPDLVPQDVGTGLQEQVVGAIGFCAILTWPLITYAQQGLFLGGRLDGLSCQVGSTLAACVWLLQYSSGLIGSPPLMDTLVQLRRNLVLRSASSSSIARQVDIALIGLRMVDAAQERVVNALDVGKDFESRMKVATEWLQTLQGLVNGAEQVKDEAAKERASEELETCSDALKDALKATVGAHDELAASHKQLRRDLDQYVLSNKTRDKILEVTSGLDERVQRAKLELSALQGETDKALKSAARFID